MQYIGDAKYGALKGTDQSVSPLSSVVSRVTSSDTFCTRLGLETDTLRTLTLKKRYQVRDDALWTQRPGSYDTLDSVQAATDG